MRIRWSVDYVPRHWDSVRVSLIQTGSSMSIIRMVLCPMSLFLLLALLIAEDAANGGAGQSNPTAQKEGEAPAPEIIELLDGADSAEGALRAFVAGEGIRR